MNVDLSDILDCMDRDDKLRFQNQQLTAIKINQRSQYSDDHLELHFASGDVINVIVTTRPSADTAFRFDSILK